MVCGIGNPGAKYQNTRHNLGFWVVEELATKLRVNLKHGQGRSLSGCFTGSDRNVILLKPLTYVNLSGKAVEYFVKRYTLQLEDILLVYDDLDLPEGRIRLRAKGGTGGHRGVRSVIQELGNDGFARLRIGIGRPPAGIDPVDHVLAPMSQMEIDCFQRSICSAVEAVESWVEVGIMETMNRFNK